jgi:hypothetical protein
MTSILLLYVLHLRSTPLLEYVTKYYFEHTDAKTAEVHRFKEFLQSYYQQTDQNM